MKNFVKVLYLHSIYCTVIAWIFVYNPWLTYGTSEATPDSGTAGVDIARYSPKMLHCCWG